MNQPGQLAYLYALSHPDTGEVRYIGKANDPHKRYAGHMRDSRTRATPVYAWIRKLSEIGLRPEMKVLMATWDWDASERALIAQWRMEGSRLLNVAEGGSEPHCPKSQRANNGRLVAASREEDCFQRARHRLLQRMGQLACYSDKLGNAPKAERLRRAQQKCRHLPVGELIARMAAMPSMLQFFPAQERSELEAIHACHR